MAVFTGQTLTTDANFISPTAGKIKIKSVDLLHLNINKLRLIAVSRESAGGVSGLRGSLFCIKV